MTKDGECLRRCPTGEGAAEDASPRDVRPYAGAKGGSPCRTACTWGRGAREQGADAPGTHVPEQAWAMETEVRPALARMPLPACLQRVGGRGSPKLTSCTARRPRKHAGDRGSSFSCQCLMRRREDATHCRMGGIQGAKRRRVCSGREVLLTGVCFWQRCAFGGIPLVFREGMGRGDARDDESAL